jgi:hypothetical protein
VSSEDACNDKVGRNDIVSCSYTAKTTLIAAPKNCFCVKDLGPELPPQIISTTTKDKDSCMDKVGKDNIKACSYGK